MASNPAPPLLLGMGLRSFSMIAARIPDVKSVLRATTTDEAEALWRSCRKLRTAAEIQDLLEAELGGRLRETAGERDNGNLSEDGNA